MNRDEDRAWAELVDSFNSAPSSDDTPPAWPESENVEPDDDNPLDHTWEKPVALGSDREPVSAGRPFDDRSAHRADEHPPGHTDDDHFIPPTPAPMPRGDLVSRAAWAGVVLGPAVLILSTAFSWTPPEGILLIAVGGFIGGFVTLIARLRGHHPDDPDNGAVL